MDVQYTPYLWVLLVAAALAAWLGIYAWRHRTVPGAALFAVLMLLAFEWCVCNMLEIASRDLQVKLFWANLQYLAFVFIPPVWLTVALQYAGLIDRSRWRRLIWLGIVPITTLLLVWTNEAHGLIRRDVYLDVSGPFSLIGKTYGPWFWVHTAYSYLLLLCSAATLLYSARRVPVVYRGQPLVLLLGLLFPYAWNILYVLRLSPIPRIDPTPVLFILSGAIVVWGLFRYRLFDLVPIARARVIESMGDGVIIVDSEGRIIESNRAAQAIIGVAGPLAARKNIAEVSSQAPDLAQLGTGQLPLRRELTITTGNGIAYYDAQASPLQVPDAGVVGRVITLRDITDRRNKELALLTSEQRVRKANERLHLLHEIDRAIAQAQSTTAIAIAVAQGTRTLVPCALAQVLSFDGVEHMVRILACETDRRAEPQHEQAFALRDWPALGDQKHGHVVTVVDLPCMKNPSAWEQTLVSHGIQQYSAIPLRTGDELLGALVLGWRQAMVLSPEQHSLVSQVADSLAVALQNARLHEQTRLDREHLQTLSRRLVAAQEDERQAIARELHDEAGQSLTALMLGLGRAAREPELPSRIQEQLAGLGRTTEGVLESLHRLAINLRPASLDRLGLVPALRQYVELFAEQSGVEAKFLAMGLDVERLPPEMETAIYRVVQEALTNVARHAQAQHVAVILEVHSEPARPDDSISLDVRQQTSNLRDSRRRLLVIVEDNGVGFDPVAAARLERLGLLGMRERAEMLGGQLTIESSPGAGATIYLELPMPGT